MSSTLRLLATILATAALFIAPACGGGDDDDDTVDSGPGAFDAPPGTIDAAGGNPDAAGANPALGQICSQTVACQAGAPDCLVASQTATQGVCSLSCATDYEATTNETGQIGLPDASYNAPCIAAFAGGVGVPVCGMITGVDPAHNPLQPNTTYTLDMHCAIQCEAGTNACPTGLTCTSGWCDL